MRLPLRLKGTIMVLSMLSIALMSMALADSCKDTNGCVYIPDGYGSDENCGGADSAHPINATSVGGGGGPGGPTATPAFTSISLSGSTAWADGQGVSGTFSNNVTVAALVISLSGVRVLDTNGAHSWGTELCVGFTYRDVNLQFEAAGQFLAIGSQVSPYTLYASGSYQTNTTDCTWGHALYGRATYLWWNANPPVDRQENAPVNCTSLVPSPDPNMSQLGFCDSAYTGA